MKKYLLVCLLALVMTPKMFAQGTQPALTNDSKMDWWRQAKFGMFIHWGLYSVPAGKWGNHTDYGEWIMNSAKISRAEYSQFAKEFNPVKFDAEAWVKLAKAAGQKYIVITSKHHDGFAMFKSNASPYNVYDATPFHRDIIKELADACHKYGMKFGLYYSEAQDWYHPGGSMSCEEWDETHKGNMDKYIDEIAIPQVKEILSNYGNLDILWWDTPFKMTQDMAQRLYDLTKKYPKIITNNRLGGGIPGDLETPEQYIPATGFPGKNWEVCMTMNNNWGYNAYDEHWKPTKELIRKLVDIASKGGNFLLNVGPNQYGEIPQVCQDELKEMGAWLDVNGESVYGVDSSPFPFLPFGRATQHHGKLYLHIFDWMPKIAIPYIAKVKKAYLLADKNISVKNYVKDGYTYFILPAYTPDKNDAVLVVECDAIPTQIAPSQGTKMMDGTESALNLSDGDPQTSWTAKDKRCELEITLPKSQIVQCLSIVEPWAPWDNQSQTYNLEAFKNGIWVPVVQWVSQGVGVTAPFKPVNTQRLRLTISNKKENVQLNEVMIMN